MATPNAKKMRTMVAKGQAMPAPGQGRPGRFNIATRADLGKAIKAVGRVKPPTEAARSKVRRFIIKRAKALNAADAIPPTWNPDGTLKTST